MYYRIFYIKTGHRFDLFTQIQRTGSDCVMLEPCTITAAANGLFSFHTLIPHFIPATEAVTNAVAMTVFSVSKESLANESLHLIQSN